MVSILSGIAGLILVLILSAAAWLLWPLPQNEFDWQQIVATELESGNCENAAIVLMVVGTALVDPEIEGQLDQISTGELCAIGSIQDAADNVERIRWLHGIMPRIYIDNSSVLIGLSDAAYRGSHIRQLRQVAGARRSWFTDSVIVYRCVRVYSDFDKGTWFRMRAEIHAATGLVQPAPAWLRRQQYYLGMITSQIEEIRALDQSKQTLELINEYEFLRFKVDEQSVISEIGMPY